MMKKIILMLFLIYPAHFCWGQTRPQPQVSTTCSTNELNLQALFLNNENYYKYLYALSMSKVGVDSELIRRATDAEAKEVLDPGSPSLKKMLEQKLVIIESLLINSGCSQKEAIRFKYKLIQDLKSAFEKTTGSKEK